MQVGFEVSAPAKTPSSGLNKVSSIHTAETVTCTECGWTGPKVDTQGLSASYCPNCGSMKGVEGDTFPYVKQIVEDAQRATYLDPGLGGVYQPAATLRAEARRAEIIDEQDDSLWSETALFVDGEDRCERCGRQTETTRIKGRGRICAPCAATPEYHLDDRKAAIRRRVLMPKKAAPQGEGYFVTGPNGGKISGPYATMAEARPHMVQERGATVQYFGPPNDPEWEAYKAQSFPVGLNTVNGSRRTAAEEHSDWGTCAHCGVGIIRDHHTNSWRADDEMNAPSWKHTHEPVNRNHPDNYSRRHQGGSRQTEASAGMGGGVAAAICSKCGTQSGSGGSCSDGGKHHWYSDFLHQEGGRRTAAPTQSTCVNCGKKIDKTEAHHGRSGYWSDSEHGGNHCPAAVGAGPHVPAQGEFLGAVDHGGNVPLQHSASDPLLDWEDKAQKSAGENASNDTPKEGSWQERQANVARIRGTRHFAEDDPVVPIADSQQSAEGTPHSSESGPCGAQYEADVWVQPQDEDYSILRCTLPAGHAGAHTDEGDEARPDSFSWQASRRVAGWVDRTGDTEINQVKDFVASQWDGSYNLQRYHDTPGYKSTWITRLLTPDGDPVFTGVKEDGTLVTLTRGSHQAAYSDGTFDEPFVDDDDDTGTFTPEENTLIDEHLAVGHLTPVAGCPYCEGHGPGREPWLMEG